MTTLFVYTLRHAQGYEYIRNVLDTLFSQYWEPISKYNFWNSGWVPTQTPERVCIVFSVNGVPGYISGKFRGTALCDPATVFNEARLLNALPNIGIKQKTTLQEFRADIAAQLELKICPARIGNILVEIDRVSMNLMGQYKGRLMPENAIIAPDLAPDYLNRIICGYPQLYAHQPSPAAISRIANHAIPRAIYGYDINV